jgi:hypothetical protein
MSATRRARSTPLYMCKQHASSSLPCLYSVSLPLVSTMGPSKRSIQPSKRSLGDPGTTELTVASQKESHKTRPTPSTHSDNRLLSPTFRICIQAGQKIQKTFLSCSRTPGVFVWQAHKSFRLDPVSICSLSSPSVTLVFGSEGQEHFAASTWRGGDAAMTRQSRDA